MLKYSALAVYRDKVAHILDAGGDIRVADQDYLMDKALKIATARYGNPMAVALINTGDGKGYTSTMARVTHDMWGRPV